MNKLMIATTIAVFALAGAASAESSVRQQQDKLDRIWAEQRANAEVKQASRNDDASFFERTFGAFELKAINPGTAESGSRSDFRAGDRGR